MKQIRRRDRAGFRRRNFGTLALLLMLGVLVTGCAGEKESGAGGGTKVVLTTGFDKDEVFKIGTASCKKAEVMVYLTNMQNQYEGVYGEQIWQRKVGDKTLEDKVKDVVLARLAQIKTMNLLAQQRNVTLSEQEEQMVCEAAEEYYASLGDAETEKLGVDEQLTEQLYREYALANKVYSQIIESTNPEISDDEARMVTVDQIFLKTYALDGEGNRTAYTQSAKNAAEEKIKSIRQMVLDGEDFGTLAARYCEDSQLTVSFCKGEKDAALEEAAFNLGKGEVSQVIETEDGFYLLKCISTLDRQQTDANKQRIMAQRKEEAFTNIYQQFMRTQIRSLNEELWDEITFVKDADVTTTSFFDVYNQYFVKN